MQSPQIFTLHYKSTDKQSPGHPHHSSAHCWFPGPGVFDQSGAGSAGRVEKQAVALEDQGTVKFRECRIVWLLTTSCAVCALTDELFHVCEGQNKQHGSP